MNDMKSSLIIAGSREFSDYAQMCGVLDDFFEHMPKIHEIVSGGARGADSLGEKYAKEHNIPLKVFPAEWDKYGKSAGYKRNEQMADYAFGVIVFWDGISPGSKHMIDIAMSKKIYCKVVLSDERRCQHCNKISKLNCEGACFYCQDSR